MVSRGGSSGQTHLGDPGEKTVYLVVRPSPHGWTLGTSIRSHNRRVNISTSMFNPVEQYALILSPFAGPRFGESRIL